MAFVKTGIENANEFFSQHYLDEVMERDLAEVFAAWRERAAAESPAKRLRAMAADYFRLRDRILRARSLAERVGPDGLVLALDRDPQAVAKTAPTLGNLPVRAVHASYVDLPDVMAACGLSAVDGVLLDLGLSSDQLADQERGFSFHSDGPLDLVGGGGATGRVGSGFIGVGWGVNC